MVAGGFDVLGGNWEDFAVILVCVVFAKQMLQEKYICYMLWKYFYQAYVKCFVIVIYLYLSLY